MPVGQGAPVVPQTQVPVPSQVSLVFVQGAPDPHLQAPPVQRSTFWASQEGLLPQAQAPVAEHLLARVASHAEQELPLGPHCVTSGGT